MTNMSRRTKDDIISARFVSCTLFLSTWSINFSSHNKIKATDLQLIFQSKQDQVGENNQVGENKLTGNTHDAIKQSNKKTSEIEFSKSMSG